MEDTEEVAVRPNQTLLEVLRDELDLVGSKRGCDDGSCGACTVLIDGEPALSCLELALVLEDANVITVEGVSRSPLAARLAESLASLGGLQCGYCTPGILLCVHSLFDAHPGVTTEEIRASLSGNLCRCTGYHSIIESVERVVEERRIGPAIHDGPA
jgi:carbon-monoxide dehydrogenase small subunit